MKILFAISVIINLLFFIYFIRLRIKVYNSNRYSKIQDETTGRKNIIKDLSIDSNFTVFVGDSQTQFFELFELLKNPNIKTGVCLEVKY
ncbi:MAG: hypothetical protein JWQ79_1239 [Mucilaginibacter sp.]|nr:hypothetical protein [Mucilaginibacter sp.]